MKAILTLLAINLITFGTFAQKHTLNKESSQLKIHGTSSLHDWTCTVGQIEASATLNGTEYKEVAFEAVVKSIKSGKSGMDNNIYDALDAGKHSKITFSADKLTIDGDKLKGTGKLTIKGSTKEIPIDLSIQQKDGYVISGQIDLKMTDFGVTPPTAIFGTVKTGDDIKIEIAFALL